VTRAVANESAGRRVRRVVRRALGADADASPRPAIPALLSELARTGPAPLVPRAATADGPLRIATIIPSFRRGSGGHATIVHLMRELAARGHHVSLWLDDFEERHADTPEQDTRESFIEFFGAGELGLQTDFHHWEGADVVLATGWQTVARALLLPGAGGRAYLVQDHEPEFYATSAERLYAADSYRHGLHCIAASPWLAALVRDRYGASATHFDLAIDEDTYRPGTEPRRDDLVAFYGRASTPRRAVPLGLLALTELASRRPGVEIAVFGADLPLGASFTHTDLGVLGSAQLGALYRQAAVGMVFSLTNPSLTGLEMMASGLPCVELDSEPMLATFGAEGPLALVKPDPMAVASALERLLDDGAERERRAGAGLELMSSRSWSGAALQVEAALREAVSSTAAR
jgi:glycosyltransferase involved in cell wall biosynthesis